MLLGVQDTDAVRKVYLKSSVIDIFTGFVLMTDF